MNLVNFGLNSLPGIKRAASKLQHSTQQCAHQRFCASLPSPGWRLLRHFRGLPVSRCCREPAPSPPIHEAHCVYTTWNTSLCLHTTYPRIALMCDSKMQSLSLDKLIGMITWFRKVQVLRISVTLRCWTLALSIVFSRTWITSKRFYHCILHISRTAVIFKAYCGGWQEKKQTKICISLFVTRIFFAGLNSYLAASKDMLFALLLKFFL